MITDIEKQLAVEAEFNECWNVYMYAIESGLIQSAFNQHAPIKPKLIFICKGIGTAGRYYKSWNQVEINTAFIPTLPLSPENKTTIAHEIAHHLTKLLFSKAVQWHGPEFRHIMQSIGLDGSTYHKMSVIEAKAVASKTKNEIQLFEF